MRGSARVGLQLALLNVGTSGVDVSITVYAAVGNRIVGTILIAVHLVALAIIPLAEPWFLALALVFPVRGLAAFGTGIAIAPLIGGAALDGIGASVVPLAAAALVLSRARSSMPATSSAERAPASIAEWVQW